MMDPHAFASLHRSDLASAGPGQISCIAITTCNNPSELRRCLMTYVRHLRECGRQLEIVVVDDSSDPELRVSCRAWLASLAQRWQAPLYYAGAEERTEYIKRLSSAGIPDHVAQFMLTNPLNIPSSPGSNRNTMLLHTVGDLALSCDDDSVCVPADLRRGDQAVNAVANGDTAIDTHFVSNRRRALDGVRHACCDLVGAHDALLGRSLTQLSIPRELTPADHLDEHLLINAMDKEGRVFVTLSGVLGDMGMPDCVKFMLATGDLRDRFLRHWQANGSPEASRYVVRGVHSPTVSPSAILMTTTATGFDNRVLLPPFTPSGRGEDTLFGVALRKCLHGVYFGYVPLALLHAPAGERQYEPPVFRFRLINLLTGVLSAYRAVPFETSAQGLRRVGRHLTDCASCSGFRSYLVSLAEERARSGIEICKSYLQVFDHQPVGWAVEIRRMIKRLELSLSQPNLGIPIDVPLTTKDDPYELLRGFVLQLGESLQSWPDIIAVALTLRANGIRVGRRLQ